jgi:hypothetical protein
MTPATLAVKDGTNGREMAGKFSSESSELTLLLGFFYIPQICDMGQDDLYIPSEGRRAEDFFALKNPTASARFKPANLSTKGQHDTSRPLKPLC